jgi:hypothetical protein
VYDLSPRDRVWAVNVTGWDNIRLGYTADTQPDEELSTLDIRYDGWRKTAGINWQRLFGSLRWDVRVDGTLSLVGRPSRRFAGVQHITNRRNVAGYTWNRRTNSSQVREQQGLFPIAAFDWRF